MDCESILEKSVGRRPNRIKNKVDEFVLPRVRGWETGEQSRYLRLFLSEINLPIIRFHDLRASCTLHSLKYFFSAIRLTKLNNLGIKFCHTYFRFLVDIYALIIHYF